ncbi:MAG TPA: class I SAM-dependent methyltransferase [Longimicrobium sp.]
MTSGAAGHPLLAYFDSFYPSRSTLAGRLLFRVGERERVHIVREWLPPTGGLSVLDAGCGDGELLAAVLAGHPARLRLEDISPRAVERAARRLAGRAGALEAVVADALEADACSFDVVLSVGVLDYHADPAGALERLLRRSRRVLIASLPRRDNPRNRARRAWFAARGGALVLVSRKAAAAMAASLGRPFDLRRGPYEWFLRIHPPVADTSAVRDRSPGG